MGIDAHDALCDMKTNQLLFIRCAGAHALDFWFLVITARSARVSTQSCYTQPLFNTPQGTLSGPLRVYASRVEAEPGNKIEALKDMLSAVYKAGTSSTASAAQRSLLVVGLEVAASVNDISIAEESA
jgi:hypothetical protein